MKKAFSTLGCPTWSFGEVVAVAKDIGMDGIEIRGLGSQMYAPSLDIFNDNQIKNTLATLKRTNLEIPILTSGCILSDDNFDKCLKSASEYINTAEKIGASFVRILIEEFPNPTKKIDIDKTSERFAQICDLARDKNVFPLIETSSVLANSVIMLDFLKKVNRANAKVLWDIHHPYRFFDEEIDYTYEKLKDYIAYIHLKDSIMKDNKVEYKMMGYGDIPIKQVIDLLKKNNYNGYISLEWVKRWCPQLEESGVAFPQYANYIDDLN